MIEVSLNLRGSMYSRETSAILVFLLTIRHPQLDEPIRLSTDPTTRLSIAPLYYGTRSRGSEFIYTGAKLTMPDDKDRGAISSQLTLLDVEQEIVELVRGVQRPPPTVKMEAVLAEDPSLVEFFYPKLEMANAKYKGSDISFDCVVDTLLNEPVPAFTFSPAYFPGLYP